MRSKRTSLVLAGLVFVVSVLLGPIAYAGNIIGNEDRFVAALDRITSNSTTRKAIAGEVAELSFEVLGAEEVVADALPEQARLFAVPATRLATSVLTSVAFEVLDTEVVSGATEAALRDLHRQFDSGQDGLEIDLRATLTSAVREVTGPIGGAVAARQLAGGSQGVYTIAEPGSSAAAAIDTVRAVPAIRMLTLLVLVGLAGAAVVTAEDRRRGALRVGLATFVGTLLALVVIAALGFSVIQTAVDDPELGFGLAQSVVADYALWQWPILLIALIIIVASLAAGSERLSRGVRDVTEALAAGHPDRAWQVLAGAIAANPAGWRFGVWATTALVLVSWPAPTTRVVAVVSALTVVALVAVALAVRSRGVDGAALPIRGSLFAAVAFAVALLVWPDWNRGTVTGLIILFVAVQAGLGALALARRYRRSWRDAQAAADEVADRASSRFGFGGRLGRPVAWGLAAVAIAGSAGWWMAGGDALAGDHSCNGQVRLCERTIDQVTFAGSHNSMSSTDLGWRLAMQSGSIVAQLDHGIRALLIDTHYWDQPGELEGGDDAAVQTIVERALAQDDAPKEGIWLCHGVCALGATDLTAALAEINLWLDANPREVLLMIIQDETDAADVEASFERSGLMTKVHYHAPAEPWPTLGSLIEADERLLVFSETQGDPDTWYQHVWDNFTETPYNYAVPSDFSCEPNRGDPANDLYLINHWVTSGIPVRDLAATINDTDSLADRVDECRQATGRLPTILAVDFAETGDLVDYVHDLNQRIEFGDR